MNTDFLDKTLAILFKEKKFKFCELIKLIGFDCWVDVESGRIFNHNGEEIEEAKTVTYFLNSMSNVEYEIIGEELDKK